MVTKKTKTDSPTDRPAPEPRRIIDIAHPGSLTPAASTSRPVIVPNRVLMQDPMMAPVPVVEQPEREEPSLAVSKTGQKLVIKPLSDQEPAAKMDAAAGNSAVDNAQPSKPDTVPDSEPDTDAKADDKPAEDSKPADVEPATPPAEQSDDNFESDKTDDVKKNALTEAEAKAQEELDGLVDEKTYFLPINAVEHRRSRHVFIFGVMIIVLLGLLWLNIAMDAGFIEIPGLKPLTHFFGG